MVPGKFRIVSRSVRYYKKPVFYQIAIIALLSAVITGSLLTGRSVRSSLKRSASEKLGNTGITISSGVRYFDQSVVKRFSDISRAKSTGILLLTGSSQNLASQKTSNNTNIIGINSDFFPFIGGETVEIKKGEIGINSRLANYLGVAAGDEIVIRYKAISEIPADAPFAPTNESAKSVVMKVGEIIADNHNGTFSLSISQIMPMNIFINLADLFDGNSGDVMINRLLIENKPDISTTDVYNNLRNILKYSDIGLTIRSLKKTEGYEIISDRVFIDNEIIQDIKNALPSSAPVITYLGNSFRIGSKTTPYSFVSALPSSIYPEICQDNEIIINRWLAEDLSASTGDTLQMSWYTPDSLSKLIEKSNKFIVKRIVEIKGIWADSMLMPQFPGISGSESCSDWDAGIPIKMNEIRTKDEDYWNKYKGTPKAFINYNKGKELWGNNFGPATSIRFPAGTSESEITTKLKGVFDPSGTGFVITDLYRESIKAANESVDFSTLFLSLGFFLILASIVLLSFAVTSYFDTKKIQINTFFALGFRSKWISHLLLTEAGLIGLIGCFAGAFAGYIVNIIITSALNSVWKGAVQTDTLIAFFNIVPILTGFLITFLITMIFMLVKVKRYIKKLNLKEKDALVRHSARWNLALLILTSISALGMFIVSFYVKSMETSLSFGSGTLLLAALLLAWRLYFIKSIKDKKEYTRQGNRLSRLYYSFYPSHAVTPILFIAAGIFAVFITGANKVNFDSEHLKRSGGTGGYLLWCETAIPVKEDLNTVAGKLSAGLDDNDLKELSFIQAKRSSGDDASCLNLNHITSPPLLGINPDDFIARNSFSFAGRLKDANIKNPWEYLNIQSPSNVIYGIADQTVLEWGLKIKIGDTLILRSESGLPMKVIIAAGLKSSVFQGSVLIGLDNFIKYYPSISGSTVMLVDGNPELSNVYERILSERFSNYGINISKTTDRLAAFYEVTNTYLSVFGVFGAFGMIIGIIGLGFVLLRNYNLRKREFALMIATGFTIKKLRNLILSEQILILFAGVSAGVISAIVATLPSITNSPDIPWVFLILMVLAILFTGLITLSLSVRVVTKDSLIAGLKKD